MTVSSTTRSRSFAWLEFACIVLAACGERAPDVRATCIDPPRGPDFDRFESARPIDFSYVNESFQGAGLAVADLDGDGRPEVIAASRDRGLTLFHNRGELRFERTAELDTTVGARAIAAADLDNDGDADLVVAGAGLALVLANQGDGTFREAARFEGSGLTEHVLPTDLDGDGKLDLYFGNNDIRGTSNGENRLYLNRGGLAFELVTGVGGGLTWSTTAFDVDADGDQDLYVANDTLLADYGDGRAQTAVLPEDLLLRNDGPGADGVPRFTDIAAVAGLATPRSSMGGLLADFDEDGRIDLYVPDFGANKLFIAQPDGRFAERASAYGVRATDRAVPECEGAQRESCLILSWTAALSDFDLDGYDELLVVNGETSPGAAPPVLLFTRTGSGAFTEVSPDLPCLDARALTVTDLDGDGDQDLVIARRNGPLAIFENRGTPAPGSWLRVTLEGGTSNRDGVGARVTIHRARGRAQTRVIGAGGTIHGGSPAEAFFGIGDDPIERLEVQWPSGSHTTLDARAIAGAVVVDEAQ